MDDPRYDPEYEYDDYDDYESGVTNVGLPASQLALIIGVNAVISLVISISVVLIAGRQAIPGDVATPAADGGQVTTKEVEDGQPDVSASSEASIPEEKVSTEGTPIQSVVYTVEPGDTLSLIADKFAVSLSDLMIANGLTNQDFIQAGQELIIPVGGLATPTSTFTPPPLPTDTPLPFDPPTPLPTDAQIPQEPAATVGPSPTPTNTPTASPSPIPTLTSAPFGEINIIISEIISPGDLLQETLVILNQGAGTSLDEWKLEGSSLGTVILPDLFLFSGGSIRIHTSAGENTASDLYLNQGEAAWPPGTTIILSDDKNVEISRFTVPSSTAATPSLTPTP